MLEIVLFLRLLIGMDRVLILYLRLFLMVWRHFLYYSIAVRVVLLIFLWNVALRRRRSMRVRFIFLFRLTLRAKVTFRVLFYALIVFHRP